ncbi:sensor histidine kinase [Spirochaeta cellobiosiphila]|uniref:sensor histidine kinase n=1 Tax=Spirochaeta cellobiosiphila TaxID=504483 RepID=UPI001B7F8E6C|nr:sensor histidine kinase [Spirochaeta cellobiosiphila]
MTKPFSQNIWFDFFLISIMLFEGVLILNTEELLMLAGILSLTSFTVKHGGMFWNVQFHSRSWDVRFSLFILTIVMSSLCIIIITTYKIIRNYSQLISNQKIVIKNLANANSGLQQYVNLAEEKSIIKERMNITRELHDTVGYTLTNLLMMLEASTDLIHTDARKLESLLNKALGIIKTGHKDIRQVLYTLRKTKPREYSSIDSIQNLTRIFTESTGITVNVRYGNLPWRLNKELDHVIFRLLQEGMTNSLTHGNALQIDVYFQLLNDFISVVIEDNGKGSHTVTEGIGISGMKERVEKVGGYLTYGNTITGFAIKANIPWISRENQNELINS